MNDRKSVTNRKKILRIVSSGFLEGGVENGVFLSNELLRKDGFEVLTISSDLRPDLKHFSDIEFKAIPTKGLKKYFANAFNLSSYNVTKKALKDFKPDIVLLHTMSQATASILFLLHDYPTILFIHGPETFTKSLLKWHMQSSDYKNATYDLKDLTVTGKLRYYYFRYICGFFYSLAFHNVNTFVALSHYTLSFLDKEGFKAVYMPNGAQLMNYKPLPVGEPIILYAGRLEKTKGIDDLINAMPNVLKKFPHAKLELAGEGSFQDSLIELVKKINIVKSITFLGHMNSTQLAQHYASCTLFVLPSIWPETFGKVGVEAMSVGRPVIATDVGGVRDWIIDGSNGFLVKSHRPDQIANKIITLLSDRNKSEAMADSAHLTAEKFSIEKMTANIEKLITQYTK